MPNKTYNTRAPAMWEIIKPHVDWGRVYVMDYGFGGGDMLLYASDAGARCMGIDTSVEAVDRLRERVIELKLDTHWWDVWPRNINHVVERNVEVIAEVGFCFSVLPYLNEPLRFIKFMRRSHATVFIECQYAGDGPGFDWLDGDFKMAEWLGMAGWRDYKPIGKTFVEDRNCYRTIWKCER